ncbi:ATP synthase F0 subunit B [Thalassoglobus polymorphus]|uniref:ATP synthase F0 subunit B n=1 Tax=Thalassoglobus polymorphus TaxID=2527994 RepID=UPI001E57C61A|nr:ATP synthase F0 subunit B [Thalassoglobus polymorphus]
MKSRSHHNLFANRQFAAQALFITTFLTCLAFVSTTNAVAEEQGNDGHPHAEDHSLNESGAKGELHHDDAHGDDHGAPPFREDTAFWSIIAFAGLCFAVVKLGLWNSLQTNMAAREEKEINLISTAEGHLTEAQQSLNQYRGQLEAMDETVAETIAEAGRDADHTQTEIIELAKREASLMLHRAEHEISRSRDQSLNSLFEHLAHRVAEATEAKVRANLQTEDQDRLIDDTLNQLVAN